MTAARGSVRRQVTIARPPDAVWAVVGDPARLAEWFPGIVSATVEGDERTIVTGSGIPMPERILTVDPLQRRFQYRVTSSLFREHLGTIDVLALEDGSSLVVYGTDADPAVMALVIAGAAGAGLRTLKQRMESTEEET